MTSMVIDDDDDIVKSSDYPYKEGEAFRKQFNPIFYFKKSESRDSFQSEEIYFKHEPYISNHNMNNISKNKEEFVPMDSYNEIFYNIFCSKNEDEDDRLISDEEECNLGPKNEFNEPYFNDDMNNFYHNKNNPIDDNPLIVKEETIKKYAPLFGDTPKNIETEKTQTLINEDPKPTKPKQIRGPRGPYKKKPKSIKKAKTDDECFPFTKGKELLNEDSGDNKLKQYMNTIFRTNIYVTDSNGNKKKEKKKRKFKPDDIRKKIKVRFHKKLKDIINENLKNAGSTKLFSFLPQYFISNISKKFNSQYMNETYENLVSIDFTEDQKDYPNKECDKNQYLKNKETLEYLKENPEISKNSGFDIVKKKKYRDIFKDYFSSAEFEKSIETLKEEGENAEYIQEYFLLAKNYIEYFMDVDENMY
jgi:hypothetical protein